MKLSFLSKIFCRFFPRNLWMSKHFWWLSIYYAVLTKVSSDTYIFLIQRFYFSYTYWNDHNLSRLITKPTKWPVRPAKTWISLGIRPVWSVFAVRSLVAKDPRFLHTDSEDSDRTWQKPRLIWVFTERAVTLLVLTCRGSILFFTLRSKVPVTAISIPVLSLY